MDIQQMAEQCQSYLTRKTRDSGESFVCQSDNAPAWFSDLIYECHLGTLPNDGSYNAIEYAIDALAAGDDEPDLDVIYPRQWFNDFPNSDYYCDMLIEEGYPAQSIADLISTAMSRHHLEVFFMVKHALETQIEGES